MTDLATQTGAAEGDETADGVKPSDTSTVVDDADTTEVDDLETTEADAEETDDGEMSDDVDRDGRSSTTDDVEDVEPTDEAEPVEDVEPTDEAEPVEAVEPTDEVESADDADAEPVTDGSEVDVDEAIASATAATTVIAEPDHAPLDAPAAAGDAPTTVLDGAEPPVAVDSDEPTVEWAPTEPRQKKRHLALWIGIPVGAAAHRHRRRPPPS